MAGGHMGTRDAGRKKNAKDVLLEIREDGISEL
jgi:hypothetical protein